MVHSLLRLNIILRANSLLLIGRMIRQNKTLQDFYRVLYSYYLLSYLTIKSRLLLWYLRKFQLILLSNSHSVLPVLRLVYR